MAMAMLPLPGWETWEKNLRSLSELHEKITGKVIDSCEDQVNETLIDITHKYLAERVNKEFEKLFGRKVYKGERLDMESVSGIDGTVATETPDIELYRASGHYDYEGHVIYTSDLARDIMSLVSGFDDDDNVIGVNYNTVDNYPGIWPGAWEYLKEHIKLLSTPCRFLKEEEIQLLSTEICHALEGIKDANVGGWLEKEWEDDEENDEEDEEDKGSTWSNVAIIRDTNIDLMPLNREGHKYQ